MTTPFPGMDPYLERPGFWEDVHHALISGLQDDLAPRVPSNYYVAVEVRVYTGEPDELILAGRGDVGLVAESGTSPAPGGRAATEPRAIAVMVPVPEEVREAYLEVRHMPTNEVVTVIEVLSPKNKRAGEGRRQYESKRMEILGSLTNLVEIDLLRAGERMSVSRAPGRGDYRILVSRGERRPRADLFAFDVREEIPGFTLPLRRGETEPTVELGGVLRDVYDRKLYHRRIDYKGPATPPLADEDAAWADVLLRSAGLR